MCIFGAARAETGHTNLGVGSIIENLQLNRLSGDQLTHVCLHKQVACLVKLVMECQVVDLVQN